jgi:hypothetical protein
MRMMLCDRRIPISIFDYYVRTADRPKGPPVDSKDRNDYNGVIESFTDRWPLHRIVSIVNAYYTYSSDKQYQRPMFDLGTGGMSHARILHCCRCE